MKREKTESEGGKEREQESRTLEDRRSLHCFLFSQAHTHTHAHTLFLFSVVLKGLKKKSPWRTNGLTCRFKAYTHTPTHVYTEGLYSSEWPHEEIQSAGHVEEFSVLPLLEK